MIDFSLLTTFFEVNISIAIVSLILRIASGSLMEE